MARSGRTDLSGPRDVYDVGSRGRWSGVWNPCLRAGYCLVEEVSVDAQHRRARHENEEPRVLWSSDWGLRYEFDADHKLELDPRETVKVKQLARF